MTEFLTLPEAIAKHVHDGNTVALEGFTHLIPFAAGQEIIRQGLTDLTLIRMTPDVIYDQMIGAGCATKLVFSWGGNPGVGQLHRFRDAMENGWPRPLEIEEHSHAGMTNRYVAGASGLPFMAMRGYTGTSLPDHTENIAFIDCPFTGERLAAVAAITPDVGIIHAQRADRRGNIQLWGITGVQAEVVLASHSTVVTVEEIVDDLDPRPSDRIIPGFAIDAVAVAPGGAKPSYALDYYERDNVEYRRWDEISSDRDRFRRWVETEIMDQP